MLPISTLMSALVTVTAVKRPVLAVVLPIDVEFSVPPRMSTTSNVEEPSTVKLRSTWASTLIVRLLIDRASNVKSPLTVIFSNVDVPELKMSPYMSPTNLLFAVIVSAVTLTFKWSTIIVLSVPNTLPLTLPRTSSVTSIVWNVDIPGPETLPVILPSTLPINLAAIASLLL